MDVDGFVGTERRRERVVGRLADGRLDAPRSRHRFRADIDLGVGPPRSKPNAPVYNKAVTFNEPEDENGKCLFVMGSLGSPLIRSRSLYRLGTRTRRCCGSRRCCESRCCESRCCESRCCESRCCESRCCESQGLSAPQSQSRPASGANRDALPETEGTACRV
jgi:hypothetical protein